MFFLASGICCGGGVSVTNGTVPAEYNNTPYDGYRGTIIWSAVSWNAAIVETYLWVDSNGHVSAVSKEAGMNLTVATAGASDKG